MRYRDVSLYRSSDTMWEIPRTGGMRVPVQIFASEMMGDILVQEAGIARKVARLKPIAVAKG